MKSILTIVVLMSVTSFQVVAAEAADSLAIFHSPSQVTVVVNEKGGAKLGQVLTALAPNEKEVIWETPNKDVKITCKRSFSPSSRDDAFSCTFRFVASEEVAIGAKSMIAKIGFEDEQAVKYFDLDFVNAQNASFKIKVTSNSLSAETNKL